MHEMSIVTSLMSIVREEMEKHGVTRLLLVRVRYGVLTNIEPSAMRFAFDTLIAGTDWAGARLELEEVPLTLRCGDCNRDFTPENSSLIDAVCPYCGCSEGHLPMTGSELLLQHLEAE